MTKRLDIYKCEICGNVVEVVHGAMGGMVCCNQVMKLMEPKSEDEGMEKHLPVVEIDGSTVKVAVGSIPHPMEDNHYIEWIELVTDSRTYRKFLTPGSAPEVEFTTACKVREVRSYCNIHGLWSTKL